MLYFMLITVVLLADGNALKRTYTKILTVSNGGPWGRWAHSPSFCRPGSTAIGYKMRIERPQGSGDDTALNAIRLVCDNGQTISSLEGPWGHWGGYYCPKGQKLVAFTLQVEQPIGKGDDTAANYIRFKCSGGSVIGGTGYWGHFGLMSRRCGRRQAICGLRTKVERPLGGKKDDTALNDVKFYCCKI